MARFTINGHELFVEQWHEEAEDILVLLHGFTGSTNTWHKVVEQLPRTVRIIAVDCIGHGQSAAPEALAPYSMVAQIEQLDALFTHLGIKRFKLLGYSMGGRVALSYAVRYQKRVQQLILESTSPGLQDEQQREERKIADDLLANKILQNGIESFVDKWENIPLFASQKRLPQEIQEAIRAERLSQNEKGLANSLRGMGTGVMPPLWDALADLSLPVTLITGEHDEKFVKLNEQMQKSLPQSIHVIIPAVGHAIHVENPTKFATIVKETISTIN